VSDCRKKRQQKKKYSDVNRKTRKVRMGTLVSAFSSGPFRAGGMHQGRMLYLERGGIGAAEIRLKKKKKKTVTREAQLKAQINPVLIMGKETPLLQLSFASPVGGGKISKKRGRG